MTTEQSTIKVGSVTINAPIRKKLWPGDVYWVVTQSGGVIKTYWPDIGEWTVQPTLEAGLCWASESDAKAYADATLILRNGGTPT